MWMYVIYQWYDNIYIHWRLWTLGYLCQQYIVWGTAGNNTQFALSLWISVVITWLPTDCPTMFHLNQCVFLYQPGSSSLIDYWHPYSQDGEALGALNGVSQHSWCVRFGPISVSCWSRQRLISNSPLAAEMWKANGFSGNIIYKWCFDKISLWVYILHACGNPNIAPGKSNICWKWHQITIKIIST